VTDVLLAESRPPQLHGAAQHIKLRRRRRSRWAALVASVALLGAAIGSLLTDASQANDRYDHARHQLAQTRAATDVVSHDLKVARIDLYLVTEQVGSDNTALAQDTAQLQGAKSALSAAQAHVFEQASLINSLHSCLGGVEQALNALAVGDQANAAAALTWVATPCSNAVNASG
jgi:chromosome segregation ATPase